MDKFTTIKKEIDIDLVTPNPWNPNFQSEAMFKKEIQSIKELGFIGSILVRDYEGFYQILDGEHRWKACKELGYTKIQIESTGEITDQEAKTLTILLNNLKGKDDIEKRVAILKQLNEGQLSLLPFTKEEIENEKKLFEFDFSQYDKQEDIEKRKPTNTLCFALTEQERKLWDRALEDMKEKNPKINEIQIFLALLKDYLWITYGIDYQGKLSTSDS